MAESLRDLVVSLSLNTDNFTRNIKSVNKQIQEAESFFKLAAAGVKDFDTSAAGLASRLGTLQSELSMQGNIVGQYQRALEQANNKLTECYNRQGEYAGKLEEARTRQAELADEVSRAQATYNTCRTTLGETNTITVAAAQRLEALKAEYSAASAEVTKLVGQNDALKRSTQNAADAVSTIQTQLNKAQAAYKNTEAEIEATNQKLALAQTEWENAGNAIKDANANISTIGKQTQLVQSEFKLAGAGLSGFETSQAGLAVKADMLTNKIELQRSAVREYASALQSAKERVQAAQEANDPEKVREATDAVTDAQTALNGAKATLRELEQELKDTNAEMAAAGSNWTALGANLTEFSKKCDKIARSSQMLGRRLTTMVTTPIVALGAKTVKTTMDFESSFTSVRKTVDATEEEFEALAAASRQMSTEIAASTTEINEVMAVGGQLGIRNEYLADFTRVMIDLGNSCEDLDADSAAESIAKFANIMGTDQSMFKNIGSTIVELGNNFATTEKPIMEMAQRLAGAGKQVGLTESQILGFAAGLSSVGIEAQMGGSAFSKALVKMEVASATGGQALDDFAEVCGMTADEFKTLWDSNPADAFMAFILGLSRMDEEGISAIATLNDMGISEIRLRDTLLRATNATDLFITAQDMANAAWEENTALTEEANKRYATTESKMTNLKNKAMLFAETIGNDMMPTIKNVMDGISGFIDRLMDLDSAQREEIIKWAAIVAAIGPALLVFGKVSKVLGVVTGGIGKFATAAGKAGGGIKGFNAALGQSPGLMLALAAAAGYGVYKLIDWASGAKAAREALEGLQETADNWKNRSAETFYGSSKGLSAFDLTEDDFVKNGMTMLELLDTVTNDWKDDMSETDETVTGYVNTFKAMTKTTRDELTEMANTAKNAGYSTVYDGIQEDMAQLDLLDAQIADLLEKRKEYYLSDEDIAELNRLISVRQEIEIKYGLSPADDAGFDKIEEAVELAEARAQATGLKVADTVYEDALVAAGEGMAAINKTLDEEYNSRYKLIQSMSGEEREQAMSELNAWYRDERRAAALEYADTMGKILKPLMSTEEYTKAAVDMSELYRRVNAYMNDSSTENLQGLSEFMEGVDADGLIEYYGVLTQITTLLDQGLGFDEISQITGIDVDTLTTALDQAAALKVMLKNMDTDKNLEPLREIFGDLGEEVLKIATDLDMTGAEARWKEFADNPGADVLTTASVTGYKEIEGISTEKIKPIVEATVRGYALGTGENEPDPAKVNPLVDAVVRAYIEGSGENAPDPAAVAPYIEAVVNGYTAGTGDDTPDPSVIYPLVTALVSAFAPGEGENKPDPETVSPFVQAVINGYTKGTGDDKPDLSEILPVVTAAVNAYTLASGDDKPDPNEIAPAVSAYVNEYALQNGTIPSTEHIAAYVKGYVSTYEKGTGEKAPDPSAVQPYVTAYVESYTPQNINLTGTVTPANMSDTVVHKWKLMNTGKVKLTADVTPQTVSGAFGDDWFQDLNAKFEAGKVKFYGTNGMPIIDVDANLIKTINASDIVVGVDENGVYHVTVKPDWAGMTEEEIDEMLNEYVPDSESYEHLTDGMNEWAALLTQGSMHWFSDSDKGLLGPLNKAADSVAGWITSTFGDEMSADEIDEYASAVAGLSYALDNMDYDYKAYEGAPEFLTTMADAVEGFNASGQNIGLVNQLLSDLADIGVVLTASDLPDYLRNMAQKAKTGGDELRGYTSIVSDARKELIKATENDDPLGETIAIERLRSNDLYGQILMLYDDLNEIQRKGGELTEDQELFREVYRDFYTLSNYIQRGMPNVANNDSLGYVDQMTTALTAMKESYEEWERAGSDSNWLEKRAEAARSFTAVDAAEIGKVVTQMKEFEAAGGVLSDAEQNFISMYTTLLQSFQYTDAANAVGIDISAGIGDGMSSYSWTENTSTLIAQIDSELRAYAGAHSPATRFIPIGTDIAEGVAQGITNGTGTVTAAITALAQAAVAAAQAALDIHSPSRVFRDDVGKMMMRGLGEGVLESTEEQARIVRNASRYLSGEAASAVVPVTNSRTNNSYDDSITISGNDFNISSEQDIRDLAREIAALTKRQQAGKGIR